MSFKIGERQIGGGAPCFIIAEVGLAHDGSLGAAHAYVDAVAKAGADAVKFQCHLGDKTDRWRIEPEYAQDEDRQAYWARTDFTPEQWWSLAAHATAEGLIFLCSPFSVEAVEMLDPLVPAWKVPSGRVLDSDMLVAMLDTGKPLIVSTGLSTSAEETNCLGFADAILQCTSLYPCPPERLSIHDIPNWYDGLSDHSGTIYAGLAAVALGASILEVHVCFSKEQGGFDASSSITVEQLTQLVEGVRFIEKALQPVDKDKLAEELKDMRNVFMGEAG